MPLRKCDRAPQVELVCEGQHLGEDCPRVGRHLLDPVAAAHEEHQVGQVPQQRRLAVGLHELRNVLLRVGARDDQDDRLGWVRQETADVAPEGRLVVARREGHVRVQRSDCGEVKAGGDYHKQWNRAAGEAARAGERRLEHRVVARVHSPLVPDLRLGAHNHAIR